MGASDWCYKTPFHSDPETALQALRRDVFESRRFGYPTADMLFRDLPPDTPTAGKIAYVVFSMTARLYNLADWMLPGF